MHASQNQTVAHSSVFRGIAQLVIKKSTSAPPPGSCLFPQIYGTKNSRRGKIWSLCGKTAKSCYPCTNGNVFNSCNSLLIPGHQDASLIFGSDDLKGRWCFKWIQDTIQGRMRHECTWNMKTKVKQDPQFSQQHMLSSDNQSTPKF